MFVLCGPPPAAGYPIAFSPCARHARRAVTHDRREILRAVHINEPSLFRWVRDAVRMFDFVETRPEPYK
eukprot:5367057-Karenia_brevis.AAC.1